MNKCKENIATQLTTDTVIAEDCQGNPIYAGNRLVKCSDLTSTSSTDTYVEGMSLNGTQLTLSRTEGQPDLVADLASLNTNDNDYANGLSLDTTSKILTISRTGSLADLSVDLTPIIGTGADGNNFVTAMSFDPTTHQLTLSRNGGLPDLTVTIPASTPTPAATRAVEIVGAYRISNPIPNGSPLDFDITAIGSTPPLQAWDSANNRIQPFETPRFASNTILLVCNHHTPETTMSLSGINPSDLTISNLRYHEWGVSFGISSNVLGGVDISLENPNQPASNTYTQFSPYRVSPIIAINFIELVTP